MSSSISLLILGLLGLSLGMPVEETYEPRNFYQSSRIVGGVDAPEGKASHMVAIVFGELVKTLLCGGALVTNKVVLTAAHCIDPVISWADGQLLSTVRGQVASNSLSSGYTVIQFSGHQNHRDWDSYLIKNDVGILYVDKPVPKHVATPIALDLKWVGGGERLWVTGWGRLSDDVIIVDPQTGRDLMTWGVIPDRLQMLRVSTLSPRECEERVQRANDELGPSPPVHRDIELCTMHKREVNHGMCNGDSGSALVDWRGRAVALVSWGWPCARGHPDVHTRLSGFKEWLLEAMGQDHAGHEDHADV